jgi:nucleotide-binding universal stress UspA family protein
MKVIIGIDESPFSRAAVDYARDALWPANSKFIVLSAAPFEAVAYSVMDVGAVSMVQEIQKEQVTKHQELAARVERELRGAGLSTVGRVDRGDPGEVIVNAALSEGADLVIVGSHGRTGLRKLVLGSVAGYVVTHAPCSVLVVKHDGSRKSHTSPVA